MASIRRFFGFLRAKVKVLDPVLLSCSSILSLISLITIIGGGETFGTRSVIMQLSATVVGLILMVVLANFDYRVLASKLWPFFFGGSVLLMILLLIDGRAEGTNQSWLYFDFLPFGIQPSEFIKTALALTFAYHLSRVNEHINRPLTLLGLAAHAGVIVALILLTGDLGVALIFTGFILIMLFCAGMSLWYFAGGAALLLIIAPILWSRLATYQQQRILVGFNPSLDPTGYGYQALMSRDAILSGGFFGQGMAGGEVYQELYASHTDFIFATVCEKMGFVGGFIVLATLLVLILRMMQIAQRSERGLGAYLAVGIAGCLILQIVLNVGMCFGVLPVVGITLPFMSYGGSSVLGIYLAMGMVHSIYAHRNRSSAIWS